VSTCNPPLFPKSLLGKLSTSFHFRKLHQKISMENKMSDTSYSSSEQGTVRDNIEDLNLREYVKRLKGNKTKRELEEIGGIFTQLMWNQRKAKGSEGSSRRIRHHEDSHSPSSHHNTYCYQSPPRQHRNRKSTFAKEPKIELPLFHGREDVEKYLDWEMKVEQIFQCHQVDH